MKVIASAAISLDGCLDDASDKRLKLSSAEDWDDVLKLRARCDAILVGAGTVRADDPSLVIRDPELRRMRRRAGLPSDIMKVAVSMSGRLDPMAGFFTGGKGEKVLFLGDESAANRFKSRARVIVMDEITPQLIVQTLEEIGVRQLLVEGGGRILTQFFEAGIVGEFRLAVAPFFVGDRDAPRLVMPGGFHSGKDSRMRLDGVRMLGDTAVMDYSVDDAADRYYLNMAVGESRKCVPDMNSYCVGAVVVAPSGNVYKGYTHETGPANHAEEEAVAKALAAGERLRGSVMYSSMEPCSQRRSKPKSCSRLIIDSGFSKVVFALREPPHFADCKGVEMLEGAGVEVVVMDETADEVRGINSHIIEM